MHCLDRAPEPFCKRLPPRTLVQGLQVRVRMWDSACVRKRLCVSLPARMHAKHVGACLFLSINLLCLCLCLSLCVSLKPINLTAQRPSGRNFCSNLGSGECYICER